RLKPTFRYYGESPLYVPLLQPGGYGTVHPANSNSIRQLGDEIPPVPLLNERGNGVGLDDIRWDRVGSLVNGVASPHDDSIFHGKDKLGLSLELLLDFIPVLIQKVLYPMRNGPLVFLGTERRNFFPLLAEYILNALSINFDVCSGYFLLHPTDLFFKAGLSKVTLAKALEGNFKLILDLLEDHLRGFVDLYALAFNGLNEF